MYKLNLALTRVLVLYKSVRLRLTETSTRVLKNAVSKSENRIKGAVAGSSQCDRAPFFFILFSCSLSLHIYPTLVHFYPRLVHFLPTITPHLVRCILHNFDAKIKFVLEGLGFCLGIFRMFWGFL